MRKHWSTECKQPIHVGDNYVYSRKDTYTIKTIHYTLISQKKHNNKQNEDTYLFNTANKAKGLTNK